MVYILCNDFISPGYLIANEQLQGPSKVGNRVTFLAINYFFFPQGKEDREITRNNLLVKLNGQRNRYLLLWNTVHFCAKCGLHSLNINRWQIRIKYLSVVDICKKKNCKIKKKISKWKAVTTEVPKLMTVTFYFYRLNRAPTLRWKLFFKKS